MIEKLQSVIESEIPITKSIGIKVENYNNKSLILSAPLEQNINHKNTAFGGSLYTVAVLSGWGLVYLLLEEHNLSGHIVIHESNVKYLKPVTTEIIAHSSFESDQQCKQFIKLYKRKGIARINIESRILCHAETSVIFKGEYVAHS